MSSRRRSTTPRSSRRSRLFRRTTNFFLSKQYNEHCPGCLRVFQPVGQLCRCRLFVRRSHRVDGPGPLRDRPGGVRAQEWRLVLSAERHLHDAAGHRRVPADEQVPGHAQAVPAHLCRDRVSLNKGVTTFLQNVQEHPFAFRASRG